MAVYYVVGGSTACLADAIDLRPYSTESAGGFTGCTVGMYASANGAISDSESFLLVVCHAESVMKPAPA